jgi:membrane protease YdiL (CAAX protease family)
MKLNSQVAVKVMLGLLSIVILFHLLIIIEMVPYKMAWGGKLQTDGQMYVFEGFTILINLFLLFTLLIKGRYIKPQLSERTIKIVLWVYFLLFVLNTIGNLFAQSNLEKLFALLTSIFAALILLILRSKSNVK